MITTGVYTFCTHDQSALKHKFSWDSTRAHLLGWVYSVTLSRRIFKKLKLYTDRHGKVLLIDILKLPFDEVHVIFDNDVLIDKSLWAISKMITYTKQYEPFLHIDSDVFLINKDVFENNKFLESHLCVQSEENPGIYKEFYEKTMNDYFETGKLSFPVSYRNTSGMKHTYNYGIFGGNAHGLIRETFNEILNCLKKGEYKQIKDDKKVRELNIFYEQFISGVIFADKGFKFDTLLKTEMKTGNKEQDVEATSIGFCHLFGDGKKDLSLIKDIDTCVKYGNPNEYDIIDFLTK